MAASGRLAPGCIGSGALACPCPAAIRCGEVPAVDGIAFGIDIIGGTMLWVYSAWWLMQAVHKMAHVIAEGDKAGRAVLLLSRQPVTDELFDFFCEFISAGVTKILIRARDDSQGHSFVSGELRLGRLDLA